MAIGDLIFQLMGKEDPRQALVQAMAGQGTPATPQPAVDTSAGAAPAPGTAAPAGTPAAPPAQSEVYQSPQELVNLYTNLLKRQDQNRQIDRGIGLIGASLAYEENRPGIMAAFNQDTGTDPTNLIQNLMKMNAGQAALSQKAAQRAAVPAIAAKYGLDVATAQYLFDTGKLDAVIAEAEKPNVEIVKDEATGTFRLVDKTNGQVGEPLGTPKKREVELVDDGKGGKMAVYKDDKSPVGKNDIPGMGATTDQQDYEAYRLDQESRQQPVLSFQEWRMTKPPSVKVDNTVNTGDSADNLTKELAKSNAERYDTEYDAATGARDTIDYVSNARSKLDKGIVSGSSLSPLELEGRKIWADIVGIPDEATSSTEAFKASLKEAVLSKIKALGSGTAISDADRKFIEQAVGGDIALTESGMRQIFDIMEKGARKKIEQYNKDVDSLIKSYPDEKERAKVRRMLRKVTAPEAATGDGDIEDLIKQYGG